MVHDGGKVPLIPVVVRNDHGPKRFGQEEARLLPLDLENADLQKGPNADEVEKCGTWLREKHISLERFEIHRQV